MNLREPRKSVITLPDYGDVTIKHMTAKEYHNFCQLTDGTERVKHAIKVSLDFDDDAYNDIPVSTVIPLFKSVMKANGLTAEQEETEVKN